MLHESNTFATGTTTRAHFLESSLDTGAAITDKWERRHHEVGGFLEGATRFGIDPVPLLVAEAMPSGPIDSEAFESLTGEMKDAVRSAGRLDGILLALHGAANAVGHPDADGEIVAGLRQLVGPELPIVMTLDMHANISPQMVRGTTATVCYRSTPHVDQRERGVEAARIMSRTLCGEIRPVQALATPPLVISVIKHDTSEEPAATLIHDVEEVLTRPHVVSASVCFGYPWADVEKMGSSFLAVADDDPDAAQDAANWLARRAWERRSDYTGSIPSVAEAVSEAVRCEGQPIVLSDIGDNIGGGSPGDATFLLEEMVSQRVANALVVLWDPEGVRQCVTAGVGAEISLAVGGKTDGLHGGPVAITGRVRTINDGCFVDETPRHSGRTHYDQGTTAVVETLRQQTIVLTSVRMAPFSLGQIRSLGIDPRRQKMITVKGVVAPRAAYREVAARFILVNTPGVSSADLGSFVYHHRRRPLFPFELDAAADPEAFAFTSSAGGTS